jgi:DsrE/DsrF-like family
MKVLFILNDPPYGTERVYNALRLAQALLKMEPQMEVTVFLMADSAAGLRPMSQSCRSLCGSQVILRREIPRLTTSNVYLAWSVHQIERSNARLAAHVRAAIALKISAHVGCAPLSFEFHAGLWFGRQLENCSLLTLTQRGQEHDLAIRKFQGVVMSSNFFFVDLPKDRCFVIYHSVSPNEQSGR